MRKPRIWFNRASRLWECAYVTSGLGLFYGSGRTPQEAYAEWRRDVANA